ncbi:MAG: glutamate-1-semialdehyde 2,1-aminomutase [Salibacteraceae bacterium]
MKRTTSEKLYKEAVKYMPGGVNSPVRAFRAVNGSPIFFERGKGSRVWDVDGNEYIDFCGSWGPLILGHAHDKVLQAVSETMVKGTSFGAPNQLETELAKVIVDNHPFVDKIRFVNSGTEAVMSAIRLARGITGKSKIIKFEGCYHGHVDSLMVMAGSGLVTFGRSTSAGIPKAFTNETIVLSLNNPEAVKTAYQRFGKDIACIIIEPIPANNGLLLQDKEFLKFLREFCDETGVLLIFDEVISGFRVGFTGAAGYYDIRPDILTFGKVIGGGFPVGAYAASDGIMQHVAPDGPVYQAGTLSGNPVAMAAGLAQLTACLQPGFYDELEEKTRRFVRQIMEHVSVEQYPFRAFHIGSIFWLSFSEKNSIKRPDELNPEAPQRFKKFFDALISKQVYIGPSSYEVGFVSQAHTDEDLSAAAKAICKALDHTFK